MSEVERLADQIRRAFEGEAWHGDSVREILRDVKFYAEPPPGQFLTRIRSGNWCSTSQPGIKSRLSVSREPPTSQPTTRTSPKVKDSSEAAWNHTLQHLWQHPHALVKAVASFPDARLMELVPGKTGDHYNFFYLFSGIVQHELYHAGQIALLKKIR